MTAQGRRGGVALGLVYAGLAVLGFSLSLPLVKVALRGFDPITVSIGRAAFASVLGAIGLVVTHARSPGGRRCARSS